MRRFPVPRFLRRVAQEAAPPATAEQSKPQSASEANTGRVQTKWLDMEFADVEVRGQRMRFATTGSSSKKRLRTLLSKEPITLAWIDTFAEGETLYDVGANVGMYTIYAAVMRKAFVHAFEPEALNYAELNKNIYLNDLHGRVLGYCVALSDVDKLDRLLLSDFGLGISYHDFQENSWKEDKAFAHDWHVSRDNRRVQGCVGHRLDTLVAEGLPAPHHIKIDVDGLEHRVVEGMIETLSSPGLKTVLIEINFDDPRNLAIVERLTKLGWRYSWQQLRINREVKFTVEKIKSYQERGVGGLNYIFYKDPKYDEIFARLFDAYTPGQPLDVSELVKTAP
ncbi:FkbM family methyltransferase [Sphingomonas agri]|uniref:FkbM family methyltransferase n=1 Tax=Sphingomonas agri TaxID=1813878 RepID=UPI00311F6131